MNLKNFYQNNVLLIVSLFILPPVAVYGIFKRGSSWLKKCLFIFIAFLFSFVWFIIVINLFASSESVKYNLATSAFKKNEYEKALKYYKEIEESSGNFQEAENKISIIEFKIDSVEKQRVLTQIKKDSIFQEKKMDFIEFQNKWSDSIVDFWKGKYITGKKISQDREKIYFTLSVNASKGGERGNELNREMYQNNYNSLLASKFDTLFNETQIVFELDPEQKLRNEANQKRKNKIMQQFSAWDGSHRKLKKYIKNNMNDPDSFEHVETTYTDKGNYITVYTKFRGNNSLGVEVINTVSAKVDIDGNIISVQ